MTDKKENNAILKIITDALEDMKAEDCTRGRVGLYLAWKASLATNYEDSFLCNRLHVTLDLSGVYINRRV